jgi:hypothetical protein
MSDAVFLGRDGQRLGPYTRAQLGAMAASGEIGAADLAWQEGMADWQPAATLLAALGINTGFAPPPLPEAAGVANPAPAADARPLSQSALYEAFLGPDNSNYYLPLFARFDAGGGAASWNWAAAFITQFWMLFRGMFLWGFLFYPLLTWAGVLVVSVAAGVVRVPAGQGLASLLFLAAYFLVPGIYGNKLFHNHVRKMIERSATLGLSGQLRREWLIRKGAGNYIVLLLLLLLIPAIIGILAAISIPAYQDYVVRSQVAEGAALAGKAKAAVADYYASRHGFPADNGAAGLPEPAAMSGQFTSQVRVEDGMVLVSYGGQANRLIAEGVLAYVPEVGGAGFQWRCNTEQTTLKNKYRPAACRN